VFNIRFAFLFFSFSFSSSYRGTLISNDQEHQWGIESTDQSLNIEKLKLQEPILFYDELTLYEDELADNGISTLTLKIRCMPSGFFILLRFFMRIDSVLIRCFDTRYHYELENSFILREYIERESAVSTLNIDMQTSSDINVVVPHLTVKQCRLDKLHFQTGTSSCAIDCRNSD
jgi:type 2A phosphatase activator TIP41